MKANEEQTGVEKYILQISLTSQHSVHKQRLEHGGKAPIQL